MIPCNSDPVDASTPNPTGSAGFTVVEVIISILVLTFGLMGMAGATALAVRQINLADISTERAAALQTTIERMRALPFDSVTGGSATVGIFSVSWTVTAPSSTDKVVEIITQGPGMTQGPGGFPMLGTAVPDTFTYRLIQ